jgi:hypothetical protein
VPPLSKRVVAIFDATQKVRNLLERWPEIATSAICKECRLAVRFAPGASWVGRDAHPAIALVLAERRRRKRAKSDGRSIWGH